MFCPLLSSSQYQQYLGAVQLADASLFPRNRMTSSGSGESISIMEAARSIQHGMDKQGFSAGFRVDPTLDQERWKKAEREY